LLIDCGCDKYNIGMTYKGWKFHQKNDRMHVNCNNSNECFEYLNPTPETDRKTREASALQYKKLKEKLLSQSNNQSNNINQLNVNDIDLDETSSPDPSSDDDDTQSDKTESDVDNNDNSNQVNNNNNPYSDSSDDEYNELNKSKVNHKNKSSNRNDKSLQPMPESLEKYNNSPSIRPEFKHGQKLNIDNNNNSLASPLVTFSNPNHKRSAPITIVDKLPPPRKFNYISFAPLGY
jgi:hypothetical protein